MERTSGRHSLIFSWWHTHTWSRRSRHSNTPQESSASNFTRSHDRAVHPAEAPFYLGFRESTVAPKCCGLFMYQFASLGLAVNWCGIVPASWYYYSVTLGSLSLARSLDHSMSLCMVSGNFTRSISPSLCFGWFHRSLPQVSKIYSQVDCVQVACLELCLCLPVCRVPIQSGMHTCRLLACTCCAGIWILLLEAAPITVALAGTNTWNAC